VRAHGERVVALLLGAPTTTNRQLSPYWQSPRMKFLHGSSMGCVGPPECPPVGAQCEVRVTRKGDGGGWVGVDSSGAHGLERLRKVRRQVRRRRRRKPGRCPQTLVQRLQRAMRLRACPRPLSSSPGARQRTCDRASHAARRLTSAAPKAAPAAAAAGRRAAAGTAAAPAASAVAAHVHAAALHCGGVCAGRPSKKGCRWAAARAGPRACVRAWPSSRKCNGRSGGLTNARQAEREVGSLVCVRDRNRLKTWCLARWPATARARAPPRAPGIFLHCFGIRSMSCSMGIG
jgi:hypothetical protein